MVSNDYFLRQVQAEALHLNKELSQLEKDKINVTKLNWCKRCVYRQIFSSYISKRAIELKSNFILPSNMITYMGSMEQYIRIAQQQLPEDKWWEVADRLVGIIKGETIEPIIPIMMDTSYLETCYIIQ